MRTSRHGFGEPRHTVVTSAPCLPQVAASMPWEHKDQTSRFGLARNACERDEGRAGGREGRAMTGAQYWLADSEARVLGPVGWKPAAALEHEVWSTSSRGLR
ncbi:MAG: hypothetical protein Q8L14_08350 [Myxococcales bacterium]|nr:hypothetical protein [Myxococcales bacterium]